MDPRITLAQKRTSKSDERSKQPSVLGFLGATASDLPKLRDLGLGLARFGRDQEAEAIFATIINLGDRHPGTAIARAHCLLRLGQVKDWIPLTQN